MNPQLYGQLIFNKAGKNIQGKKDSLCNKWCWENWTASWTRMNLDHVLMPYRKINSEWMKDLNVRQETINILEEKAGKNLFDLGHSNFLLNTFLEARETKAKMNSWDLIKIKSFCTVKETISKTKRQPTKWEKIFANDISDKRLIPQIYKEINKLNAQKTNNPVKKWAEDVIKHFSKEDIQLTNRHMKRCSTSFIVREI